MKNSWARYQKHHARKNSTNWNFLKNLKLLLWNYPIKIKRWATHLENIFVKHISNKGLMSRVYKDYWKFSSYNQSIQLENEQNIWADISLKSISDGK